MRFSLLCAVLLLAPRALAEPVTGDETSPPESPWASASLAVDGRLTITWFSDLPTVAAQAYVGATPPDDDTETAQYRTVLASDLPRPATRHEAVVSIPSQLQYWPFLAQGGTIRYMVACAQDRPEGVRYRFSKDYRFGFIVSNGQYLPLPTLIDGPHVGDVTTDAITIEWRCDPPVAARLELSGRAPQALPAAEHHSVRVTGLPADHAQPYRVVLQGQHGEMASPWYTFRTAPPVGAKTRFRFAALSDSRGNAAEAAFGGDIGGVNQTTVRQLVHHAWRHDPRFFMYVGDLFDGSMKLQEHKYQIRTWKQTVSSVWARIPFYGVLGNHDLDYKNYHMFNGHRVHAAVDGPNSAAMVWMREMIHPTNGPHSPAEDNGHTYREGVYSFDYGNSHFTVLCNDYVFIHEDTMYWPGIIPTEIVEWAREDLRAARERGMEHLFVFFHQPAFPNGGHVRGSMYHNGNPIFVQARNAFWTMLCEFKVLAVFMGHEHNYSRTLIDDSVNPAFTHPIWHITTGAGGAPHYARDVNVHWADKVEAFSTLKHYVMVEVEGERVSMHATSISGQRIDQVELKEASSALRLR